MKRTINPFFLLYQYLIVIPIWAVITIWAALSTIILSPICPNTKVSYFPARFWARSVCALFFVRVKVSGMEKLDKNQSYVFVMNHQSWFDIFLVYGWLPFFFKWVMKADLRRIPFVGAACAVAGHIFVDRTSPKAAKESLEKAKKALKNGISVVIFPEGTRTYDGKMGTFKRGGFKIASDLGLPIVPVTLSGCFERMPRNHFNIKPGVMKMCVHDPIDVNDFIPGKEPELIQKTWDVINSAL